MEVSKLIQNMREQGIGIWTEGGKIRYLKKDGKLDDDIKNILIYNKKEIISYFEEERERFDKFPLTDIQMAYLLGRKNSFEYGDVASHLYLELDYPALDSVKVQKIWNQLIDKHDMLRAIVLEDGTQEVLRDVAEYPIYISTKCEEIRSKWSDKYYNTETWPMFDIGVTEDKEKTTLHLSFDFLIADWASIWTLLIEFETIYYNKGNGDEKCAISFRNYVLNEVGMKNSSRYRRDKEYWKNRLDIIPEAPVLPMRSNAEKSNKFIRMARKLSAEDWEKIKFFSSQNSVTPTATVLSIFALCIERWSVNKKFSLNLTTLIRNNKYTGIYNTIGDFTSVDVLEIDLSEKIIFADFVKNVNKQIFEDLDHSSYSGIEVIRDLRKRRKNPMLFFPIIFTSSIGLIKNDGMVGKVNNNGISQTPQAFLDCQVMDNEEGLFINWDIRNGIFEEGVIQDIFCTFLTYLKKISESVEFWNQQANVELPEKQMDQRKNVNSTFKEIKMDTLQNLFLKSALEMPKKTAVVDECGEHTYEELLWTAYGIADELQKCSCKAGDYVGIKLNKSFFQIASVLGTLLIGAAFVPIDNDQPEIRADKILEIAKIKCLIGEKEETHKYREKYKWIDKDSVILKKSYDEIVNDNFDDVAYVIFTSGSTGEPKGVVIEQQAVVNTIIDINERFQVKDKDSILALSQLHFDLSVYDIFGMLATGGTIVKALKRYLPQYMIPFFLQFIDEIPCTSNGKVDRQAIRKLFIDKRDDKIQHKRWELENLIDKEIYSILISVLKVDALYPDDNLFELGADSLLMAQIAGRVKEIIEQTKTSVTFDEILRQILNNPTGEAITTFVKSKQNILTSENVRTDDFRIIEKTAKDTVYIFFHTALGTTNCYRFVEKELRKEDLGDFLFINVEDVEWYYSIQYHELVDRITDEYVRKIEQLHYKNINLIGYCLGGILALNVAVKLLEKGIEVNNLFVIDSYPVSGKVEDEFIDEIVIFRMELHKM